MRRKKNALRRKLKNFLLLYFMFFTLYFTTITLSKYIGKINGNTIPVSVAKWEVALSTTTDTLDIVSGNNTQSYILKVTSTSEVAIDYSLIMSNLPDEIEISIDNGEYNNPTNNELVFNNIGSFDACDTNSLNEHVITFKAPLDSNIESVNEINLDVIFIQKEI